MARTLFMALGLVVAALTLGCHHSRDRVVGVDRPPFTVEGVYSVTGDDEVAIYWRENQNPEDVDYYKVYRNNQPTGTFTHIGSADEPPFIDRQVTNGVTYYYAVSAVDFSGRESAELSFENVHDTPRPEGFGVVLTDANTTPALSGWDFSAQTRRSQSDVLTDIYFSSNAGDRLIVATGTTEIQDAGYVELIDVDFAPPAGWSPEGIVEAIPGHSYIVLTMDGHYAKFHVVSVDANNVVIDWAYQIDPDNPELAPKLARTP